jgi:hypothetical protein
MFDDARGAAPLSLSAVGKTSLMLHLPFNLPVTVTGAGYEPQANRKFFF